MKRVQMSDYPVALQVTLSQTIPYNILTRFNASLNRVYAYAFTTNPSNQSGSDSDSDNSRTLVNLVLGRNLSITLTISDTEQSYMVLMYNID
jgi:hypothetical protein